MDFLRSRIEYLQQLPHASAGELSKGAGSPALPPTEAVVGEAIKLLEGLAVKGWKFAVGTMVLGPIPAGGIRIDMLTALGLASLRLHNTGTAEVSLDWVDEKFLSLPADEAVRAFKLALLVVLAETLAKQRVRRFRVKDLEGFECAVFGADCFLKNWPHITTTGVDLRQKGEFFYVVANGRIAHDSAFFSEEEMQYLEEVVVDPPVAASTEPAARSH